MTNSSTLTLDERISALLDGHLDGAGFEATLAELTTDPQAAQTWANFHVVGDVLRSKELAPRPGDANFLQRFEERLALENRDALEHSAKDQRAVPMALPVRPDRAVLRSSNAESFHWKIAAGAACMALAGVMGLSLWNDYRSGGREQLASTAPAPSVAAATAQSPTGSEVMIRDPRLDALMSAHRELGGHSALQMPAGFLRNATYDGSGR
jgi:sigma-E factor negative regulatory protein RseA